MIIGVTGNLATGKSTVSRYLKDLLGGSTYSFSGTVTSNSFMQGMVNRKGGNPINNPGVDYNWEATRVR